MSAAGPIDGYLAELGTALNVRGSARRRFLRECRDHLLDAARERGEADAVRAFGPATEVAAGFDAEVAARRGVRSTAASTLAVIATGASTLALIHAASPSATAPTAWAITFFLAAQLAGLSAGLASVQAFAIRRLPTSPAEMTLLARRNTYALVAAGLTMFAAGAAVPGNGSAALLLAGPATASVAMAGVVRARSLARRLEGSKELVVRTPLEDLGQVVGLPAISLPSASLLPLITFMAGAAAFVWDRGEQGSLTEALLAAGIEGTALVALFVIAGARLGLRHR